MEKTFASALIAALYYALDSLHVGIVVFSHDATLKIPLKNIKEINGVRNETETLVHVGNSDFGDVRRALYNTRSSCFSTNEDRTGIANLAIVITGSMHPETHWQRPEPESTFNEADTLRKSGVTIIAVGTNDVDVGFLRGISSEGDRSNYFQTASVSEMDQLVQPILTRALDTATGKHPKQ